MNQALPKAPKTSRKRPTSALLVHEGRPSVYDSDKEMLEDINTLINGLVPMHTIRAMRNNLQPRARVKWDTHTEFAEHLVQNVREKFVETFGTQSETQIRDLPVDHCFPDWKTAIGAFLDNSNPPTLPGMQGDEPLGTEWDFSPMSATSYPPKQWFRNEYIVLKPKTEIVYRNYNSIPQSREEDRRQELEDEVHSTQAMFDKLIEDDYLEKFRVAAEIQKDINAGKFNPALQLRVDQFKKQLTKDDRVQYAPNPGASDHTLLPLSALKGIRASYIKTGEIPSLDGSNSKEQRKMDHDMMTLAIKTAKKLGLKPFVPFLKLIRHSFKLEPLGHSAVLVKELMGQLPALQEFLEVRAFFPEKMDVPGYDDLKAQIDNDYVPPKLSFSYEEAEQWVKLYQRNRISKIEKRISEEAQEDNPNADPEDDSEEDIDEKLQKVNPQYTVDRLLILSFKLKSVWVSEILLPQIDPNMPGQTATVDQRSRIIDVPSRWLLAFKKLSWPTVGDDDLPQVLLMHSPQTEDPVTNEKIE